MGDNQGYLAESEIGVIDFDACRTFVVCRHLEAGAAPFPRGHIRPYGVGL